MTYQCTHRNVEVSNTRQVTAVHKHRIVLGGHGGGKRLAWTAASELDSTMITATCLDCGRQWKGSQYITPEQRDDIPLWVFQAVRLSGLHFNLIVEEDEE